MVVIEVKTQGLYDAQLNFEDDEVGERPDGWDGIDDAARIKKIVDNFSGHKRVYHNQAVTSTSLSEYTTTISHASGTVEFWIHYVSGGTDGDAAFALHQDSSGDMPFELRYWNATGKWMTPRGNIAAFDGNCDPLDDTWYWFKIDFECGAGGYEGLAADTWKITIIAPEGEYTSAAIAAAVGEDTNNIDRIRFDCDRVGMDCYLDAMDFSWSDGYVTRRNRDLADGDDITSSTIDAKIITELRKVPKATLRVNGQTFENDDIIQVTDNYTSFKNGRGNFKDSLHFRDDTIGSIPADVTQGAWTDNDGASCESIIIDKYNGHSYILQLADYNAATLAQMDFALTSGQTSGSVEFWIAVTSITSNNQFRLFDEGAALSAGIRIYDSKFEYYHKPVGAAEWLDFGDTAPLIGKWYRCTITFDCDGDTLSYAIVDKDDVGIASQSGLTMASIPTTIDSIRTVGANASLNYLFFIDAIGFTWDTAYTLGDNADLEITLADQTIFEGQIIKQDKMSIQTLQLKSITAEMEQSIDDGTDLPAGYIPNMLSVLAGKLDHVTATEQDEIYRATYNFLNDTAGNAPMGWTVSSAPLVIVADIDGHKNILVSPRAGTNLYARNYFEEQAFGSTEFYLRFTVLAGVRHYMHHTGSGGTPCTVAINASKWQYLNAGGWLDVPNVGQPPAINTWYHIVINWESTAGAYKGLAQNTYEVIIDGTSSGGTAMYNNSGVYHIIFSNDSGNGTFYLDALGLSWDKRYPEYHNYTIGDNKQILVDEHEASTIRAAVHTADVVINKSNKASKVYNDLSDEELSTWYILPSKEISMNLGDEDSGFDLASGDKVWAVKGIDNITRINKVVVKGGDDGVDWALGEADDSDAQTTYGIKLIMVYAPEIKNDTDADNLAAEILVKYQNAPNKTSFFLHNTTYGMLQVGETITIPADTFYYSKSLTFIAAGEWIITKIVYDPDTGISQITVVDNLVFEPDEDDIKFIEDMVRQI